MTAAAPVPAAPAGQLRRLVPIALAGLLAIWQYSFNSASPEPRRAYAMSASMGLCADAKYFFYFFHHFGEFPVGAREVPQLGPSRRDAEEFVARHGDRLRMDFGWPTNTPRFGDYAKLFLFYPDLWIRRDPAHPSTLAANELIFIVALVAVFAAFWNEGHPLLATLIAVLVGSDPFQLVETYGRANVFSIPISVALLALAAHVRFLSGRKGVDRQAWAIAIASGAVLATAREIRAEAGLIAVTVVATYACVRGASRTRRLLLIAAFVAAWAVTGLAWSRYWASRFASAERFVARAGGEVFRSRHATHHAFWHAVYCGLGDYGSDRGFSWDDREAFRWATTWDPATNPAPIPYHYMGGYYFAETHDGVHHVAPTDLPEYNRLVRARVLAEIRRHPGWYAGILWNRLLALQRDATPASLGAGSWALAVPGTGWLLVPILAVALLRRRWFHAGLVLFTLPLGAVALLVYSGGGMTYYGIAHLIAIAVAIDLLLRMRRPAAVGRAHVR